jgi:hypothetical protein
MRFTRVWMFLCIAFFAAGTFPDRVVADVAASSRSLSVRFPAFSLNPGQKVAGLRMKTSKGKIQSSCLPRGWTCERQNNAIRCYSMHPSYALAMTGKLPELFIRELPENGSRLTLETAIEYLDSNGVESQQEFRESDLIVK